MANTKTRDYDKEYKKYGKSTAAKKYRAELNRYNRKRGRMVTGITWMRLTKADEYEGLSSLL